MKRRLSRVLGGAFIFAIAGGLWGAYGAYALRRAIWLPVIPAAIGVLMVVASTMLEKTVNRLPDEPAPPEIARADARARKTFIVVNIAQGVAIFLAVQIWFNLHKPEFLAPTIAT